VLLVVHENIILREASRSVFLKEGAVTSMQNVNFWEGKTRIASLVDGTILLTDERCPERPVSEVSI
jgi:hypothetical protein